MTKRTYGHTKSGTPITDDLIDELADDAERGYDVDEIVARRRQARPPPTRLRALDGRVRSS
jgi:hypothetical protein